MLEAKEISLSRRGERLFSGLSLAVSPGQITALIGPSGSGKSSLLSCLAGISLPQEGCVVLDQKPLAEVPGLYPSVTAVFQELFLWPHLTLRENILLALPGDSSQADELIAEFGLQACIDRYPEQASLGQRQRAALVRALVLSPRYLLLDEITSAQDVEQIQVIAACLERLRKAGTGILLVTHLVGLARRLADQTLFLDAGEILPLGGNLQINSSKNTRVQQFLSLVDA
jgi:polar amino acid transport system ATP-binding protein